MAKNCGNLIALMENDIDHIQDRFKSEEKRVFDSIKFLMEKSGTKTSEAPLMARDEPASTPPSGVGIKSTAIVKSGSKSPSSVHPSIPRPPSNTLVTDIDKQLGGFYGSVELRDALKDAQFHMDAVVAVLHRVCQFVRTPLVRLEVEQFLHNLTTLKKVFICVLNRMEIPDSDEFLDAVMAKSLADCKVSCSQSSIASTTASK